MLYTVYKVNYSKLKQNKQLVMRFGLFFCFLVIIEFNLQFFLQPDGYSEQNVDPVQSIYPKWQYLVDHLKVGF